MRSSSSCCRVYESYEYIDDANGAEGTPSSALSAKPSPKAAPAPDKKPAPHASPITTLLGAPGYDIISPEYPPQYPCAYAPA